MPYLRLVLWTRRSSEPFVSSPSHSNAGSWISEGTQQDKTSGLSLDSKDCTISARTGELHAPCFLCSLVVVAVTDGIDGQEWESTQRRYDERAGLSMGRVL